MKDEEKNEVVEAVRERVRMADAWAKTTGYKPADYFDSMMDLRRMLKAWDTRPAPCCAEKGVPDAIKILTEAMRDPGYRESWKANIAMAFKDEMARSVVHKSVHEIANTAADEFLRLLFYRAGEVYPPPAAQPEKAQPEKCGCDMVWNCEGRDPECASFGIGPAPAPVDGKAVEEAK